MATRKSIDASIRWYSCRRSKRKGVVPRPSVRVLGFIRINNADIDERKRKDEMNGQKHVHTPNPTTPRQNENKAKNEMTPMSLMYMSNKQIEANKTELGKLFLFFFVVSVSFPLTCSMPRLSSIWKKGRKESMANKRGIQCINGEIRKLC